MDFYLELRDILATSLHFEVPLEKNQPIIQVEIEINVNELANNHFKL